MASSNPVFNNSPAFTPNGNKAADMYRPGQSVDSSNLSASQLQELYSQPSAGPVDTDRMTYEDTIVKSVVSFGILLVGAAVGWFIPVLAIPAAIAGFVLALVNIFKKKPSPPLILMYAAAQGVFVGGVSRFFEQSYPGIAVQAVLGTLVVVGVVLALFANGKVRASKKATKIFLVAMVGYLVFSLVNLVLTWTDVLDGFGLREGPLGLIIGVLVILLASYSLVLNFDEVKTGVQRGAPRIYGWTAAFGIMVTVVWLYIEILRLIAIFRD